MPNRPRKDMWVCVESSFACRVCAFRLPLNDLHMSESLVCARCGLEQAFDTMAYAVGLGAAHSVADTHGDPLVASISSEVAEIGTSRCSREAQLGGDNDLVFMLSPDVPFVRSATRFSR
jgi:hypothetical protein